MRGLGSRHRQFGVNDLTPQERTERELAKADRTIAQLRHQVEALRSTVKTIDRLARPYVQPEERHRARPQASAWRTLNVDARKR